MLPFLILVVILPLIAFVLAQFVSGDWAATVASYFPTYSPEMAIYSLGDTTPISLYGIIRMMVVGDVVTAEPGKNTVVMMIVSFVLGAVMLYIGEKVIRRRDM